ncbi:MAG: BREX-1 system phosphatase PglZ type B [Actinomycetes bacterium]
MITTFVRTASRTTTVRERLLDALAHAASFNSQDVVEPVALLWPDHSAAWTAVVQDLGKYLTVVSLGPFVEGLGEGPAQWLRIRAALRARDDEVETQHPLVVYLPGISRKQLSDPTLLPEEHRSLAALSFRSAVFAHPNGSDWTPVGFFSNIGEGLGLTVARDNHTREALAGALVALLDEPVIKLQGQQLNADYLNALTVGDEVRGILRWLDNEDDFRAQATTSGTWKAFVGVLRHNYKINPERDGVLAAAEKLGERANGWSVVWDRFCEAPRNYQGIPDLLRRARPQGQLTLGALTGELTWPQDNDDAEKDLATALKALAHSSPAEIRSNVDTLERSHGPRRDSVWADLGSAPLADCLESLVDLATLTQAQPIGVTVNELARSYTDKYWMTDSAFVQALAALPPGDPNLPVVVAFAEALYRPWLEASAQSFQQSWFASPPTDGQPAGVSGDEQVGTCALFVDGLRFDVAAQLNTELTERGVQASLSWGLASVPTVTGTCKPAVTPVADSFGPGDELTPRVNPGGSKYAQPVLRKELAASGWHDFPASETGDPSGRGWTEGGDIDTLGHALGAKLANRLPGEVRNLANRIAELLAAGWRRIVVVTDHGWLLLPSKLPKTSMEEHLANPRKGRCARLRDAAATPDGTQILPWRWDPDVRIAIAPGIYAYEAGKAYEHGGLSLQESVVPRLVVTASEERSARTESGPIVDMQWVGLALKVQVIGVSGDVRADLRWHASQESSSLLGSPKVLKNGKARLMVGDNDGGKEAVLVLLDSDGQALAQRPTTVPEV